MSSSTSSRRSEFGIPLLIFVVSFAVYALTAGRTICSGDSGDFIVAASLLGVPHPSGYPLFTMAAHLFGTLLPIGEWAFRVNVFVALTGAVAVLFTYLFLHVMLTDKPLQRAASAFGALSLAFGSTTWSQATISEVYSLNLAFLAALLYFIERWRRASDDGTQTGNRQLAWICFLFGLAVTNHLTIVFLFPLFLGYVLRHKPSLLGKQAFLLIPYAALILLPLSLYAYLPLATKYGHSPIRWGMTDTMDRLLFHLSGKRYANYMFPGWDFFQFSCREYFGTLLSAEFGALLAFAPVGLVVVLRDRRNLLTGLLLLGIWIIETGYALNYATPDIDAYYLPSYLVIACFLGIGASAIAGYVASRLAAGGNDRFFRLAGLTVGLLPILPLTVHYGIADRSNDYREKNYALNILRSCPPNAIVILAQDTVFSLWYEQYLYKVRPDVLVIQYSLFTGSDISYWYAASLRRAYPAYTPLLPEPNAPSTNDAGLVRLMEKALATGHPILTLPETNLFPTPTRTLQVLAAKAKKNQGESQSPAPASDSSAVTYGEWVGTNTYTIPYGLCVRLYPRKVDGKSVPAPPLRDIVMTNDTLWGSFTLDGVFVDHWRTDPDPLHFPIAGQYTQMVTDYGKLAEQAGAFETARSCYQNAITIFPAPDAVAGLNRLRDR